MFCGCRSIWALERVWCPMNAGAPLSLPRVSASRARDTGRAVSEENVELTRRAFQAFNDRDLDALLAGLHDEVEAFPHLAALEGEYRGHDGVHRWWAQLLDAFRDFRVEILEVRDLGEFIVLALRLRGRGAQSDTPLDATVWHVNEFRDRKVIRWRVYTSETEALEAVEAVGVDPFVRAVASTRGRWPSSYLRAKATRR